MHAPGQATALTRSQCTPSRTSAGLRPPANDLDSTHTASPSCSLAWPPRLMGPFTSFFNDVLECTIRVCGFENIFAKVGSSLCFDLIEHLAVDALRCR